jgi:hypothetical protein
MRYFHGSEVKIDPLRIKMAKFERIEESDVLQKVSV